MLTTGAENLFFLPFLSQNYKKTKERTKEPQISITNAEKYH